MADLYRDVAAAVAASSEKGAAGAARLQEARQALEDASLALDAAVIGAGAPEAEQAVVLLNEAMQGLERVVDVVNTGIKAVTNYQPNLSTAPEAPAGQPARPSRPGDASTPSGKSDRRHPAKSIDEIRKELPPDIPPRVRGERRVVGKTHGQYFPSDESDGTEVVSGHDELSKQAEQVLAELGAPGAAVTATHVETKVAAAMRASGATSATLVVNNVPCSDAWGCDNLVPVLVPEGGKLTVYGARDFYKEYKGGAKPPWET